MAIRFTSALGFAVVLTSCTSPVDGPDPARCGDGVVASGEQCDDGNAVDADGCNTDCRLSPFSYLKPSNTGPSQWFGHVLALSADGRTLAVGAAYESSAASGVDGDAKNRDAASAGAVYVFALRGSTWTQQAYVKASNPDAGDDFGMTVALSADGNTLAVGALHETSAATGVDGDQASNTTIHSGAAYVFVRSGETWRQQSYLKPPGNAYSAQFGTSVALSGDGNTLAVGARADAGTEDDPAGTAAPDTGAVHVFARTGETWQPQAYLKTSLPNVGMFGETVVLSSDGATLAVGASRENGAAIGIDGDETAQTGHASGAAYVFARSGSTWTRQAYIKASNPDDGDGFGRSIALSSDGATLAVGAPFEASAATGIDGDQGNTAAATEWPGAVYLFGRSGATWSQRAYVKASNRGGMFGASVAFAADGAILAVGAPAESSAGTGFGGDEADRTAQWAGAAFVFARFDDSLQQLAYIKSSNTGAGDLFGTNVAISASGTSLAVGADAEASAAVGVGGDQHDDSAEVAGAAYVVSLLPLVALAPHE